MSSTLATTGDHLVTRKLTYKHLLLRANPLPRLKFAFSDYHTVADF